MRGILLAILLAVIPAWPQQLLLCHDAVNIDPKFAIQVSLIDSAPAIPMPPLMPPLGLAEITATFTPQSEATFKAVFGSRIKGVALVQVEICNGGMAMVNVHAGRVFQAAQSKGLLTVSPILVGPTLFRSERRGWMSVTLEVAHWLSWGATVLTGSDVVSANRAVRAALPLISQGAAELGGRLRANRNDLSLVHRSFLDGVIPIPPASCESRLLLALGEPKPEQATFQVE